MHNEEIKKILDDIIGSIGLGDAAPNDDAVREWLLAASFQVWGANKMFSEDYLPALLAIKAQEYTAAQVITALDCAGEEGRVLDIPQFFRNVVEKDLEAGTCESREAVDKIGSFLVTVALVNGDFTIEEAGVVQKICASLQDYCDSRSVVPGKRWVDRLQMVTPLNETSYHKKEKDDHAAFVQPSKENSQPQDKTENAPATITIRLNLIGDEAEPGNKEDSQSEGLAVRKPENDAAAGETLEDVLSDLDSLVGLDKVKEDVHSLLNFIKICQLRTQRGMKVPTVSYHLVFTGNPGTGKTTVARMVAKLYYLMGILPQGQLVETDRSGLVAGYLGQTAIKTQKVIQEALGGVLFIDEAYSLLNDDQDSYGKEAIETLLKAMEDHRDELVVIVAGYDGLMHKFINANPGLRSRFNKYFQFPDYDGASLFQILKRFCDSYGYALADDAIPLLTEKLNDVFERREEHFGNARSVRNLFEHAINNQANRLVLDADITDRELEELVADDFLPAMEVM